MGVAALLNAGSKERGGARVSARPLRCSSPCPTQGDTMRGARNERSPSVAFGASTTPVFCGGGTLLTTATLTERPRVPLFFEFAPAGNVRAHECLEEPPVDRYAQVQ